jgi:hypothetical protein
MTDVETLLGVLASFEFLVYRCEGDYSQIQVHVVYVIEPCKTDSEKKVPLNTSLRSVAKATVPREKKPCIKISPSRHLDIINSLIVNYYTVTQTNKLGSNSIVETLALVQHGFLLCKIEIL